MSKRAAEDQQSSIAHDALQLVRLVDGVELFEGCEVPRGAILHAPIVEPIEGRGCGNCVGAHIWEVHPISDGHLGKLNSLHDTIQGVARRSEDGTAVMLPALGV